MTQLLFLDFECREDGGTSVHSFREVVQLDGYLVALRSDDEASNVSVDQVRVGTYYLVGARGLPLRALDSIPIKLACRPGDVIEVQLRQMTPGKRGEGRLLAIVHPAPPPAPSSYALELRAR